MKSNSPVPASPPTLDQFRQQPSDSVDSGSCSWPQSDHSSSSPGEPTAEQPTPPTAQQADGHSGGGYPEWMGNTTGMFERMLSDANAQTELMRHWMEDNIDSRFEYERQRRDNLEHQMQEVTAFVGQFHSDFRLHTIPQQMQVVEGVESEGTLQGQRTTPQQMQVVEGVDLTHKTAESEMAEEESES